MNNRLFIALLTLAGLLWLAPQVAGRAQEASPTPGPTNGTVTATLPPGLPRITSPLGGEALQGSFPIEGSLPGADFAGAELSFAYQADAPQTWFLIAELNQIPEDPVLAQWDTTTITDGIYALRLLVTRLDGSQSSTIVSGLRVRNYSPVETTTPTALILTATPEPGEPPAPSATMIPTETPVPLTPTPLPPNPAHINQMDILVTMGKGALVILGFLCLLGLYQLIKARLRGHDDQLS